MSAQPGPIDEWLCRHRRRCAVGHSAARIDVQLPLLSLPRVLKTILSSIPADVPYINADPELISLAGPTGRLQGLKVGIAWQGNPQHKGDRWRSVPLERFAGFAEIPGVRLVSVQKGFGSEQLKQRPGLALDLSSELDDLADTAAVLKCLDLVISVDTPLSHLAGALAVPVWLALSSTPTGVGCWAATTAPGIRPCAYSVSPGFTSGTTCLPEFGLP